MPPALKRCEQHEDIGGTVTLIFIINARWLTAFHRHWRSGFADQLFRGLIQADQRPVRIARPCVDRQISSIAATKAAIAAREMT